MIYSPPPNRLQRELSRRRNKLLCIFAGLITALCLEMVLVKPEIALAAEILDTGEANAGASVVYIWNEIDLDQYPINTNGEKVTAQTGALISTGALVLSATNNDATCSVKMRVYKGGSNPEEGTLWAEASIDQIGINASLLWRDFVFDDPWVMEEGITYWFLVYKTSNCETNNSDTFMRYSGVSPINGINLFYHNIALQTWPEDTTRWVPLRLTGDFIAPTATLTPSSTSINQYETVTFLAEWQDFDFTPYYLYFAEDVNDNDYEKIVEMYPMGGVTGSGTWTFPHTFNTYDYGQPYPATIALGNSSCSTMTASGCILVFATVATSISVGDPAAVDLDALYPSTMTGSKYFALAGESIEFTYDITPPCTITGKRFFAGYSDSFARFDSGAVLPIGNSGTVSHTYTDTNGGVMYWPYINVYCNDGTSRQLHTVSTWRKATGVLNTSKARGIAVRTDEQAVLDSYYLRPMINGGGETTGSGSYFASDAQVYQTGEPVLFRFLFHAPFEADSVLIFETGSGGAAFPYGTIGEYDSTIQGRFKFHETSYAKAGEYQPFVRIYSSNPLVYQDVYLGGQNYPIPLNRIYVTSSIYGAVEQLFNTEDGIFGLDPSTFQLDFGATDNSFLMDLQKGFSKILSFALYIVNFGYNTLKQSPVLSFFTDVIHPPSGATYTFPTSLFGFTLPVRPNGGVFTVSYASPSSGFANLEYILHALVAILVVRFVFRSIFA